MFAEDEASLYLQATLMRVWAKKGQTPVIKVAANRDNTHFYGALNLRNGHEVVLRSGLMNAQVSALFLQQLLAAYPDVCILLLWDRAPWHRGTAITAVLEANPRLEMMWFPPGSPELNPQEQVWKATREAVSHNHQAVRLDILAEEFETHLKTTRFPCDLLEKHNFHAISTIFK